MEDLGRRLANGLRAGQVVFVQGDLGAGKTTLIRGLLAGLGISDTVKSPTYTLLEPYKTPAFDVLHLDLYRLRDARELDQLGLRDYLDGLNVCIVEWPERALNRLPAPDCRLAIEHTGENTRSVNLYCMTESGKTLCAAVA